MASARDLAALQEGGSLAENFFLDRSLESIQEESKDLFSKIGNIVSIGKACD